MLPRPHKLCFVWDRVEGGAGGAVLKEVSVLWVGASLLSPSQKEEQGWQCRIRETLEDDKPCGFKGTGICLCQAGLWGCLSLGDKGMKWRSQNGMG